MSRRNPRQRERAREPVCQAHPECDRLALYPRVISHPQTGQPFRLWHCDRHKLQLDRIKREDDGAAKVAAQMMAVNFGYDPSQRRWRRLSDIAAEQQAA